MSDFDDWEAEVDNKATETKATTSSAYANESEEIIKPKYEAPKKVEKDDTDDYEKIWLEKNKHRLEKAKLNQKALEGLDDKTRQKKLEEKSILDSVEEFIGDDTKDTKTAAAIRPLEVEKDFIDLAQTNVARVKESTKPSKFKFTYLKQTVDLLAPTFDSVKINDLINDLKFLFNKKRDEERKKDGVVKKNTAKVSLASGKGIDKGYIRDALDVDDAEIEEEGYNDDDFM